MEPLIFRQRDSAWAEETLGEGGDTLAESGCLVCSVAMALRTFGVPETPNSLNHKLSAAGGYTKDGWLIWRVLSDLFRPRLTVDLPPAYSHDLLRQALRSGGRVVAKFTLPSGRPHWVFVDESTKNQILVLDPHGTEPQSLPETHPFEALRILKWNDLTTPKNTACS